MQIRSSWRILRSFTFCLEKIHKKMDSSLEQHYNEIELKFKTCFHNLEAFIIKRETGRSSDVNEHDYAQMR